MTINTSNLFLDTYEASRQRFRDDLARVQARWPGAKLERHAVDIDEDLTIDWIWADATANRKKLIIFTTGEHGAEGYVGSAMMKLFIEENLDQLNSQGTGLLLVHAINPWGMKHMRRVNPHNVDLNRNFVWDEADLNPAANPNYSSLNPFLNPQKPLRGYAAANSAFLFKLIRTLVSPGESILREAMLMGQYRFPQGMYFGGAQIQEESRLLMDLYREGMRLYDHIIHLDIHSGYGPRYQMSLVNSPLEHRSPQALAHAFEYPSVVAATPGEFYVMQGDMVDWMYRLHEQEFRTKRLYSTAFEFGTFGDSLMASIRSMRAMILENQAHWFGASSPAIVRRVQVDFRELFYPQEVAWREKAVSDARQAYQGILAAEGFIDAA